MPATLKVLARGTAMVHAHHREGVREYVGRTYDPALGAAGGWPPSSTPVEIPMVGEFILAPRDGDLWAADEATAKVAGVPFDPKYGGEYVQADKAEAELTPAVKP